MFEKKPTTCVECDGDLTEVRCSKGCVFCVIVCPTCDHAQAVNSFVTSHEKECAYKKPLTLTEARNAVA